MNVLQCPVQAVLMSVLGLRKTANYLDSACFPGALVTTMYAESCHLETAPVLANSSCCSWGPFLEVKNKVFNLCTTEAGDANYRWSAVTDFTSLP